MKNGFTLVELSIVLVIIGLLIGGILVAQSMIKTAKVNSFIATINQFDVGVTTFREKYKQFPGDSNLFSPAGNNDGFVTDGLMACCGATMTTEYNRENKNFWPELYANGLMLPGIPGGLSNIAFGDNSPPRAGSNIPQIPLGEKTGVLAFSRSSAVAAGGVPFSSGIITATVDIPPANYYFIANFENQTNHVISSAGNAVRNWRESIPVSEAQAIDSKMDDGMRNTGNVYNGSYFSSGCSQTTSGPYDIAGGLNCALMIRMAYHYQQ